MKMMMIIVVDDDHLGLVVMMISTKIFYLT